MQIYLQSNVTAFELLAAVIYGRAKVCRIRSYHRRLQGGGQGGHGPPKGLTKMKKMGKFAAFGII